MMLQQLFGNNNNFKLTSQSFKNKITNINQQVTDKDLNIPLSFKTL